MSRKTLAASVLACAVVSAVCIVLLYAGFIRFNYPSFERHPVQGVDVSHHQGSIEWSVLERSPAQFAYIKASEGATFKDPRFDENWKGALAASVVPGAYHYFTLCKSGAEQAANFVSAAAWTRSHGLPPAVDLEFGGNCSQRPSADEFASELRSFLDAVEQEWGCVPVLYVTQEFHRHYIANRFSSYPIWVRDIFRQPRLEDGRQWRLWQFANRGRLTGVGAFIDLNVFNGSIADFAAFRCSPRVT
ncbi:MAG TPA: GH25 family lysozyme [Burkholderiales bacterium]|nr:GH25 family lysozyme [Burkholderiales bacterium]